MTRRARLGAVGFASLALLPVGLFVGSVGLEPGEVMSVLTGGGSATHRDLVLGFRLPRLLLASILGGGLALAGATFQALLRNPLAEPYILGVSGGAAVGAVIVLALGLTTLASWTLPLAAFAGALLAIAIVFRVATAAGRALDVRG